jgi:transcriptional regulator with XRE-family HTH domain
VDIKVCYFFKEERKRLNLSQKNIADFLDMSTKQIGRWESSVAISADKLALLAELDFDVLFVITGMRSEPIAEQQSQPLNREEEVLLDNFRNSSAEAKAALKATSNALAQRKVNKKMG